LEGLATGRPPKVGTGARIWRAKEPAQATRRRQFLEDLIGNIPVYHYGAGAQGMPHRFRAASPGHPDRFQDLLIGISAFGF